MGSEMCIRDSFSNISLIIDGKILVQLPRTLTNTLYKKFSNQASKLNCLEILEADSDIKRHQMLEAEIKISAEAVHFGLLVKGSMDQMFRLI